MYFFIKRKKGKELGNIIVDRKNAPYSALFIFLNIQ